MTIRTSSIIVPAIAAVLAGSAGCASSTTSEPKASPAAYSSPAAKAEVAAPSVAKTPYPLAAESVQRPGFRVFDTGDRWWVLREGSADLARFLRDGQPAHSVTRIAAGPGRTTLRAPDAETIDAYLVARHGFHTEIRGGLVWVLRDHSDELSRFKESGPPAQSVTRVSAASNGMSVRSIDAETIDAYLAAKPGYFTLMHDGRLWVMTEGSPTHQKWVESRTLPAHSVTRPGGGPRGLTIRADDASIIDAYLAAQPGFETVIRENLLWVLRDGSPEHVKFKAEGFPAHSVTRVAAGPGGRSIRAVDVETIDAYLASAR